MDLLDRLLPKVGERVQRYELLEELGRGGFGAVFRARQAGLDADVAIKFMIPQTSAVGQFTERFRREALIMKRLEHPASLKVRDYGQTNEGLPFLVTEFVRGRPLSKLIEERPLPAPRVIRIATQVLGALIEAHHHGVIHRDLKPDNIMVRDIVGEEDAVKVLDFGISKLQRDASFQTVTGASFGTPWFMAPEQVRAEKDPDGRIDLYALGLIMAECLTGLRVVQATDAMSAAVVQARPEPLRFDPALQSSPLWPVIWRATQKRREDRYPDARSMRDALQQVERSLWGQPSSAGGHYPVSAAITAPPPSQPVPHTPPPAVVGPSRPSVAPLASVASPSSAAIGPPAPSSGAPPPAQRPRGQPGRGGSRVLLWLFALAALSAAGAVALLLTSDRGPSDTDEGTERVDETVVLAMSDVPLIPRDKLYAPAAFASPALAPDGGRLAYLAPHEGEIHVWVRTLSALDDRPLATAPGSFTLSWSRDGSRILYLREVSDGGQRLFAVSPEGGAARDLTPYAGVHAALVNLPRHRSDLALVAVDVQGPHELYRVNLQTGHAEPTSVGLTGPLLFDGDGEVRLSAQQGPNGLVVYARASPTEALVERARLPGVEGLSANFVGLSADARTAHLLSSQGADTTGLMTLDLQSGRLAPVWHDDQYDVTWVMTHPLTGEVEAVAVTRERLEWTALSPERQADLERLAAQPGVLNVVSRDDADENWVVAYQEDVAPLRYYHYHRPSEGLHALGSGYPELDEIALAEMTPIAYRARDGLTIHGYLTQPRFGRGPYPTVLLVHDGPRWRNAWGYWPLTQLLANRGYAVLEVNFRGSAGYGRDFVAAGNGQWGRAMQDDLVDAVGWAVEQGVAEPGRVCIVGQGFGGYAALLGLAVAPDLYTCAASLGGWLDLLNYVAAVSSGSEVYSAYLRERIGDPAADADRLRAASPLHRSDAMRAPLLIAHGTNPSMRPEESEQLVDALRQRGVPATQLVFPDEHFNVTHPENTMAFVAILEAFLAEHLGGRFEPIGGGLERSSVEVRAGAEQVPGLPEALARPR